MRRKRTISKLKAFTASCASSCLLILNTQIIDFAQANYMCAKTMPDGSVDEVIVKSRKEKLKCEQKSSCKCELIMVTCLIGPDSLGNFQREQTPLSYAEACDREKCVCSSHDNYVEIAESRVIKS